MKYYSIDVETTGLNTEKCELLEFAALMEDTNNLKSREDIPTYEKIIIRDFMCGQPGAFHMNNRIMKILSEYEHAELKGVFASGYNLIHEGNLARDFYYFSLEHYAGMDKEKVDDLRRRKKMDRKLKIWVAGKNFSAFDKIFILRIPEFSRYFQIVHRVADPSTIYTDFINDEAFSNLPTILERLDLDSNISHKASDDAWNVIQALRPFYGMHKDLILMLKNNARSLKNNNLI